MAHRDRAILARLPVDGDAPRRARLVLATVAAADRPGVVELDTTRLDSLGIALVPEGRLLFTQLSVLQNLELGAFHRDDVMTPQQFASKYVELPLEPGNVSQS